jgi:hypothetical protein
MNANTRKTVWALVAGFLVVVVPTLATDAVLHIVGVFPPWGQSMGRSGARRAATMRHALWLGSIGLAVSIFGAAFTWNKGPAFGPHWYPLSLVALVVLVVLVMPQAWLGGKLGEKQMQVTA